MRKITSKFHHNIIKYPFGLNRAKVANASASRAHPHTAIKDKCSPPSVTSTEFNYREI